MAAGLDPDAFWKQTPRTFVTILEGRARAAKRKMDDDISLAWHTAALSAAAQCGKLKKLEHYLADRPKAQTPEQMLDAMWAFKSRGAGMTIRRVH